jgi:hypothetical protein
MTIDAGSAALVVAVITLGSGAIGGLIQRKFAADDRQGAEARLEARERKARLREYELRRIDHTRRQIERARSTVIAAMAGKATEPLGDLELSDMALVGDKKAAQQFGRLLVGLAGSLNDHLTKTGRLPTRLPTPDEHNHLVEARYQVMKALDAQERRALADEPLILLEPNDYR